MSLVHLDKIEGSKLQAFDIEVIDCNPLSVKINNRIPKCYNCNNISKEAVEDI